MNIAQRSLVLLIRAYQAVLSPALGAFFGPSGRCRYTPSCSHYALEAVCVHGALSGGFLAVKRLCRCHPWAPFGEDPVPERKTPKSTVQHSTFNIQHPGKLQSSNSELVPQVNQ